MIARVLHVVPDLIPYGLERMVATLATMSDRARFEVSIVSLYSRQPGSLAASLEAEGIRVFDLGKRRGLDLRMFERIRRLIAQLRPEVVHTHNYVLRYTLPASLLYRTPVLVHTIHNLAEREVDRAGLWLHKIAFRKAVHPVVIAETVAGSFEKVYRMPRPSLIMNGIDVARYAAGPDRNAWRQQQGFDADDLLFVCTARLYPQKNHRDLLASFAAGPAQLPSCRLLLAGDGALLSQLRQQACDLGISQRVHFLGRRDDIAEMLAACDVFVLASLWEGNPLSVMEALAAGLPAVVTGAGAITELVDSGTHGKVVPPGDVHSLTQAMMRLANDSHLRRTMSAAAATRAQARFDAARMVEAYQSLYGRLLPSAVH